MPSSHFKLWWDFEVDFDNCSDHGGKTDTVGNVRIQQRQIGPEDIVLDSTAYALLSIVSLSVVDQNLSSVNDHNRQQYSSSSSSTCTTTVSTTRVSIVAGLVETEEHQSLYTYVIVQERTNYTRITQYTKGTMQSSLPV